MPPKSTKLQVLYGCCSLPVANTRKSGFGENSVECTCCKIRFHLSCLKMKKTDIRSNYFCVNCLKISNFSFEMAKVNKSLNENNIDASGSDLHNFEALCHEHMDRIWPFLQERIQKVICESTSELLGKIQKLETEVGEMHKQQHFMQQKQQCRSRACNVVIRGVESSVAADKEIVKIIASKIKFDLKEEEIISIWSSKNININTDNSQRSIKRNPLFIVTFSDVMVKTGFLRAFSKAIRGGLNLDMSLFGPNDDSIYKKIYIGHHFDRDTLGIFLKVRKLKKECSISFYSVIKGQIFVKINDGDHLKHIQSILDLNKLLPNCQIPN